MAADTAKTLPQEKYAYAAATVRLHENALLGNDFLEQLLAAKGYDDVRRQLVERGWITADPNEDDEYLQKQLASSWAMLQEVLPEPHRLDGLILKNDYHNLKAAVKCGFSGQPYEHYLLRPTVYEAQDIAKAVSDRRFDALPDARMPAAAEKAYDVFLRTQDGQYADVYIDTAALVATREAGRRANSPLLNDITELMCVAANVKTALRAARTNKDAHFLDAALCACDTLDKASLAAAALKGDGSESALRACLLTTPYADCVKAAQNGADAPLSLSGLEKWFDDRIMARLQPVKYTFFGPEPLIAYYLAREAEVRNIRILLSGKRHEVEDSVIRERMRQLYV